MEGEHVKFGYKSLAISDKYYSFFFSFIVNTFLLTRSYDAQWGKGTVGAKSNISEHGHGYRGTDPGGAIRPSGDMKRVSPEVATFTLLLTLNSSGFNWRCSESRA